MRQSDHLSAVFECNVYLQAIVNENGPAAKVIRWVERERIDLFVSEEIIKEVRDVLTRSKLQAKFPRLTPERAEALLQFLLQKATLIESVPERFHFERDPKDEKYVNLAFAANVTYLVSRDKDLLDLMTNADFRVNAPNLTILDPVMFLQQTEGTE